MKMSYRIVILFSIIIAICIPFSLAYKPGDVINYRVSCHNTNGRGMQIYGHTVNDSIDNLYVHDNYIHHNSTTGAILGGGDGGGGSYNYEYLKNV